MAHKHSVYDTDAHFKIDAKTRTISNISATKITLIQYDHNSERLTFVMPRYVEGYDMTECTEVRIHYLNVSNKGQEWAGVYPVDDLEICTEDENMIVFTWLISQSATQFAGSLNFLIRFDCRTDNTVDYVWNTAIHSAISISNGMYNGDDIVVEYADILAEWEYRIESVENKGVLPDVTIADNGKMLQVVDGAWAVVAVKDSTIATYVDDYINEALGGDY